MLAQYYQVNFRDLRAGDDYHVSGWYNKSIERDDIAGRVVDDSARSRTRVIANIRILTNIQIGIFYSYIEIDLYIRDY